MGYPARSKSARLRCVCAPIAAATAMLGHSFGAELSPTLVLIDLDESDSQTITVSNSEDHATAMQISISPRTGDGSNAATIDVFPPQAIIEANTSKQFLISWTGDQKPETSQSYRFTAQELPIDIPDATGRDYQMRILVELVGDLHVFPGASQPRVSVSAYEVFEGEGSLVVNIDNAGAKFAYLSEYSIELKSGTGAPLRIYTGADILAAMEGDSFIGPGGSARVALPFEQSGGPVATVRIFRADRDEEASNNRPN